MARNNWARDAFRKAQNLMSRGYGDFEPKTVVTKDQLSDLSDVITTSRPSMVGPNELDEYMQSPWNIETPLDAAATAVKEEAPIETMYENEFNLDTVEQDAINLEEKNAYRNKDPNRAQSAFDKWAAPDDLTEQEYTQKQTMMAIQLIEKELNDTKYNSFTKMTPGEKEKRDTRITELKREQTRLMEKYRARDFAQGTPKEEARKKVEEGKQYYKDNEPELIELKDSIIEGGKKTWNENKDKLDPNFVEMIEKTIPGLLGDAKDYVNDFNPEATKEWLNTKYKQATAPDLEQDDEASQYLDFLKDKEGFEPEAYNNFNEKYDTIGYGHNGPDVRKGVVLNERQAENLLRQDIEERLPQIKKAIPKFDSLPMEVKQNIVGSWFRGSLSGSPKTLELINAGLFVQAADEFLNNNEYRTTENRGVKKRMKATADALRSLEGR